MVYIVDIAVVLFLLYFIRRGVKKGGARGVLELFSFVVTIVAMLVCRELITNSLLSIPMVNDWVLSLEKIISENMLFSDSIPAWLPALQDGVGVLAEQLVSVVVCILGVVVSYFIIRVVFNFFMGIVDKIMSVPILKQFNRLIGGVLGGVKGCVILWIVMALLLLLSAVPFFGDVMACIQQSSLTRWLYDHNLLMSIFMGK